MSTLTDEEFLAQCEEEFKDRYTEKDEEFMKVFNAVPPLPPVIENKRMPNNSRRYERRHNRLYRPYNRDRYNRDRGYHDRERRDNFSRGYQDARSSGNDNFSGGYQDSGNRENYRRGYSDYDQDNRSYGNRYGQRPN